MRTSRDSGMSVNLAKRLLIAHTAEGYVGSTDWSWDADQSTQGFGPGKNKCNLFVASVLAQSGADPGLPNGWRNPSPPGSNQWADPNYKIPGWIVLGPADSAEPGDVVAQSAHFRDAFGHVMIVGFNDTFVGTQDGDFVPIQGIVGRIKRKENIVGPTATGPLVFRRYVGE